MWLFLKSSGAPGGRIPSRHPSNCLSVNRTRTSDGRRVSQRRKNAVITQRKNYLNPAPQRKQRGAIAFARYRDISGIGIFFQELRTVPNRRFPGQRSPRDRDAPRGFLRSCLRFPVVSQMKKRIEAEEILAPGPAEPRDLGKFVEIRLHDRRFEPDLDAVRLEKIKPLHEGVERSRRPGHFFVGGPGHAVDRNLDVSGRISLEKPNVFLSRTRVALVKKRKRAALFS